LGNQVGDLDVEAPNAGRVIRVSLDERRTALRVPTPTERRLGGTVDRRGATTDQQEERAEVR
jgi:hypothetical protein